MLMTCDDSDKIEKQLYDKKEPTCKGWEAYTAANGAYARLYLHDKYKNGDDLPSGGLKSDGEFSSVPLDFFVSLLVTCHMRTANQNGWTEPPVGQRMW